MAGETILTIVGNLTADPELRTTGTGTQVCGFTIASTPRAWNRQANQYEDGQSLFMRCSAWRDLAGHCAQSLSRWSVPSGNLNLIYPGQVVTYNGGGSVATGSNAPPATRTVTVRAGDTLSGIAARLGISYTQLTGYRSGNPNVIYPGEVLHY